jgi:hypothetical protein
MTQAAEISKVERSTSVQRSPRVLLFLVIGFSFMAGEGVTRGIRHLQTAYIEYDWVSDFFMAAAGLAVAVASGFRLLNAKNGGLSSKTDWRVNPHV